MKTPPRVSAPTSNPSSFPPLIEDDFSYYYPFFQDVIPPALPSSPALPEMLPHRGCRPLADDADESAGNRRRRKKRNIARLITSLAALDAQEESDRRELEDDLYLLRANHEKKAATLLDYYFRFQDHYSDLDADDSLRTTKDSTAASAAAAAAAALADAAYVGDPAPHQHQRRLWVKDRSRAWWERCSHPDFPEEEFRRAFRMGRTTFDMICEGLGAAVAKEDTTLRAAIPVRQRVAVCIWRLATGEPLRLVSKRFGLGISTCHKLVLEVCSAIRSVLMPRYLRWPDLASAAAIKARFEAVSGIPNVLGSMYTTHIPIIAPKISVAAYYNRRHTERNQKTSYSITVQGVVDPDGVFTDVCIGWPGSMPDDQVLEKSALYHRAEEKGMLRNAWIVGSSGHPLLDWVLVPYTQQNLTWTKHAFNEKIGEVQRIAREAFARLKGRWSCLQKRTEVKLQDLPVVLGACCVLHNICEMSKEEMYHEFNYELVDDEMVPDNGIRSESSMQARDNIAHNLLHQGLGGTTFF
ncbi:hypothetical protein MA16_Dca007742 [Dendrobium catenatum]|uniref:DDE Tnp4 domain-containing protein n=2 Tax=Dendrobium catenatum TaxID=906689 RepID=A0A2I0X598_9ASPA|nr:hypothetical protein MA16_Dca007742 [Dendrobium catenatum]